MGSIAFTTAPRRAFSERYDILTQVGPCSLNGQLQVGGATVRCGTASFSSMDQMVKSMGLTSGLFSGWEPVPKSLQVGLAPVLGDVGCVGRRTVLWEHVSTSKRGTGPLLKVLFQQIHVYWGITPTLIDTKIFCSSRFRSDPDNDPGRLLSSMDSLCRQVDPGRACCQDPVVL